MIKTLHLCTLLGLFFSATISFSQTKLLNTTHGKQIQNYLEEQPFDKGDLQDLIVVNDYVSKKTNITHIYINQYHQGIKINNALSSIAIKDNKVVYFGNSFISNLNEKVNTRTPAITPLVAIQKAASHLKLGSTAGLKLLNTIGTNEFVFSKGTLSKEDIPISLVFTSTQTGELKLSWNVSIYTIDGKHYWTVSVDATSGELIEVNDGVLSCNFDIPTERKWNTNNVTTQKAEPVFNLFKSSNSMLLDGSQYNVYPLPLENPNHGPRQLVTNPANALASPYGWHDTNGVVGAEFTITRGNNVYAYEDINDVNAPGISPDGGSSLSFDFTQDFNQNPFLNTETVQNINSSVTNLFYLNNMMHDIWYHYGFDEPAGNFQNNNYGNGGLAGDYINAEALDGGGTNNAKFFTGSDGIISNMEMFVFTGGFAPSYLSVNSPASIAGEYFAPEAEFGPGISTPITGDVVLLTDDIAPVNDGCNTITNGASLANKIVLIDRGTCNFTSKVENAQFWGALAVIIANNVTDPPFIMGGTNFNIVIPSIMIALEDANLIKAQLQSGIVNATLVGSTNLQDRDVCFDNGIVNHEYGHGISIRLTGGASTTTCLNNNEQMGEGWSDWFALVTTIQPDDVSENIRGIGTYATFQPIDGNGIRSYPYTTNMAINPQTYDAIKTEIIPHGVGSVWCSMLWDLTWAYIDKYGFDPDLYNGTGGNNKVMQLVIDGLKLQPCSPGFIDGRDALLAADELLTGGTDACLIWQVFAKRGLGYSATQGSTNSITDGVEAFDVPPLGITANLNTDICGTQSLELGFLNYNLPENPLFQIDYSYNIDGGSSTNESFFGTLSSCELATIPITIGSLTRGSHILNVTVTNPLTNTISFIVNSNDNGLENEVNTFEAVEDVLIAYDKDQLTSTWNTGVASGTLLNTTAAGSQVYGTNLSGNYNNETTAYLVSQCYDLSNLDNTFIQFDMAFDLESNFDVLYLEYSINGGTSWSKLGNATDSNWYNSSNETCSTCVGGQWTGEGELASTHSAGGTNANMHPFSYSLSAFDSSGSAETNILFRFVLHTNTLIAEEGAMIDNFVVLGDPSSTLSVTNNQYLDLSIYPNPTNGKLMIESTHNLKDATISVLDITGRLLNHHANITTINNNTISIDINHFSVGTYLVTIQKDNFNATKRIIKN